jgi:hypothetical protein
MMHSINHWCESALPRIAENLPFLGLPPLVISRLRHFCHRPWPKDGVIVVQRSCWLMEICDRRTCPFTNKPHLHSLARQLIMRQARNCRFGTPCNPSPEATRKESSLACMFALLSNPD